MGTGKGGGFSDTSPSVVVPFAGPQTTAQISFSLVALRICNLRLEGQGLSTAQATPRFNAGSLG